MYKIELVNKQTKEIIVYDNLEDNNEGEKLFYNFKLNVKDLADGEYALSLYEDGELVATDTLNIGNFSQNAIQYSKGENIYVETLLTTKTEDKKVEITNIKTTIYPTDGKDAMTSVEVDASNVFDGGYEVGFTDGKFDGYEDGVIDGIKQGEENVVKNTDVLNVTENGTYFTSFTQVEDLADNEMITGIFPNGSPFYGYAHMTDISFETGIREARRMEVWWKPDGNYVAGVNDCGICGDEGSALQIYVKKTDEIKIVGRVGEQEISIVDSPFGWYHFIVSLDDGFFINGEKIGDFDNVGQLGNWKICINELRYSYEGWGRANGYYGMVIIDNNIFIPTNDGFVNYTTKTPLEVHRLGEYDYAEKKPFEGNLIRTVNVNVPPKINVAQNGIKFGRSIFAEVPECFDFEGITNTTYMFYFSDLVTAPYFDFGNVVNANGMYYNCSKLTSVPLYNTSNLVTAEQLFYSCSSLTTIPQFDFSKLQTAKEMFYSTTKLQSVPLLNFGNVTDISRFFSYSDNKNITDLGGFRDLKIDWNDTYGLYRCPNLTYQSVLNVINNLYDFRINGDNSTTRTLKLHANSLSLLSDDDKAIATDKGWILTT